MGQFFRHSYTYWVIEKENIKEGEDVIVLMKKEKKNILRETFGTYKIKKSTKQIMEEVDKELTYD
jgi:hypothetical protein